MMIKDTLDLLSKFVCSLIQNHHVVQVIAHPTFVRVRVQVRRYVELCSPKTC